MIDWPREKVLVTGGSGFLGANLIHLLVRDNRVPQGSIRSFFHRDSASIDDLPGIEKRLGDVLDPVMLADACRDRTLVFHTAGSISFDPREKKRQWLLNVEGTRNVLEAVRAARTVRRLCHTSTVNVLGASREPGWIGTEGSSPYAARPRLHSFASAEEAVGFADAVHDGRAPGAWWKRIGIGYLDSKLAAQELVNRAVRRGDVDAVSVLPGTFFGPYDEFLGPGRFIRAVREGRVPGVLRGGLPLAHAGDVAAGHALAMERGVSGGLYILGGLPDDNRTLADMMSIIAGVLREKEPSRPVRTSFPVIPRRVAWLAAAAEEMRARLMNQEATLTRGAVRGGTAFNFYSSEKARRELGYSPWRSFHDAVAEMYDYLNRRGLLGSLPGGRS